MGNGQGSSSQQNPDQHEGVDGMTDDQQPPPMDLNTLNSLLGDDPDGDDGLEYHATLDAQAKAALGVREEYDELGEK